MKIALPKGHLWDETKALLDRAGYGIKVRDVRSYTVSSNDPELEMRTYRAQNISPLVEEGKYDLGITGYDWVVEFNAEVQQLLDLDYGRVDVVAAVSQRYNLKSVGSEAVFKELMAAMKRESKERIIVASEYENITTNLCKTMLNMPFKLIRSYGATETFLEVADMIVDCAETGRSLKENGWQPIYTLFSSTARLIANKQSLENAWKKDKIDGFMALLQGAIEGKGRKLLKMNVPENALKEVLKILPAMKSPTISKLVENRETGYAVEVAVKEEQVVNLIPLLKKKGATDILEIDIKKAIR